MPQLELRPARCRVTTGHGKKIPSIFLLATLSVTSVQIEHAVHLVVLLGRHISRRVGVVVDPPHDLFLSAFYSIFIFFSRLPCAGLLTLSFFLCSVTPLRSQKRSLGGGEVGRLCDWSCCIN